MRAKEKPSRESWATDQGTNDAGESRAWHACFDGSLNGYLGKCLKIIALFDDFIVQHVSRDENTMANDLAQQASGFQSNRGKFYILEKLDVLVCQNQMFQFSADAVYRNLFC
jgi:hypothetical protein